VIRYLWNPGTTNPVSWVAPRPTLVDREVRGAQVVKAGGWGSPLVRPCKRLRMTMVSEITPMVKNGMSGTYRMATMAAPTSTA
jgi:hypothetical protein